MDAKRVPHCKSSTRRNQLAAGAVGQVFNLSKMKGDLGEIETVTSVSLSETDIRVSERHGYVP